MQVTSRLKRKSDIEFAVGMAAIDGGKPSVFTQALLKKYEEGLITSKELKEAIIKSMRRKTNNQWIFMYM